MKLFASLILAVVSMPQQIDYRIGQFTNVHITSPPAQHIRVECAGMLPVEIDASGQSIDAEIPLLFLTTPGYLVKATTDSEPQQFEVAFTELPPIHDERIIGPDSAIVPVAYEPVILSS